MQEALSFNHITEDLILFPDNSPFREITQKKISLSVLRLDKIHPFISGNKWFKLRYYLDEAASLGKKKILTFGGAWSNHIAATAAICNLHAIPCIGIIRGEEPAIPSSTLLFAKQTGMQLVFISRHDYKQKKIPLPISSEDNYIINEGGYGEPGARGASTILEFCSKEYSHYCCATGTGTMLAGLINAAVPGQQVTGISVMKSNRELEEKVADLVQNKTIDWQLLHDYHFGGYAKHQPALIRFMNEFYEHAGVPSDFVYTAKLFYAVTDLIKKDFFIPGSRILLVHSGGLQGNASLDKGTLIF